MIEQTHENTGITPKQASADSAYNTGQALTELEEKGILAYLPDCGASGPSSEERNQALADARDGKDLTNEQLSLILDPRTGRISREAFRYERTRFVPEHGNWLETSDAEKKLRQDGSESTLALAWCYGAPGIGLTRLHAMKRLSDAFVREDLDIALTTTLTNGFGRNHSLCHGDFGNLDFVSQVARARGDAQLASRVDHIASIVVRSIESHGRLCGVPLGVESPSLMNGLSGIGYGLLRTAAPDRVPSVLVLDPPVPS